jgi:hypothetical protein
MLLKLIAAVLFLCLPPDATTTYCTSCCICNDLGKLKAQVSSLTGKESKTEHLLNKQKDQIEILLKDVKLIKGMLQRLTTIQNLATTSTENPRTTKAKTTNSPTTYPPTTYPPTTYPPTTLPERTSSPATPSPTTAEATCPDSTWFRKSGSCYKFNLNFWNSWTNAKADCERRGKCIKAMHACIYTQTHKHTHTCMHAHTHSKRHTNTHAFMQIHTHTCKKCVKHIRSYFYKFKFLSSKHFFHNWID